MPQEHNGRAQLSGIAHSVPAPTDSGAVAVRATKPPVIDGTDDDAVWRDAPPITAFRQWQPTEGGEARFRTEAKVAYDAANLYVFVRAFDPHPDSIIKILERRDTFTPSDMIWLFIDSYHDHRTGYEFGVNAAGVKIDQAVYDDGNEDSAWDGVWDVATRIDSLGWTAEFRIPLSQLRYSRDRSHTFGFTIDRDIYRFNERVSWPLFRQSQDRIRLAVRFTQRVGRPRGAAPSRGDAVRRDQERFAHQRQPLHRSLRRHARRRPQVPRRVEPHARRDDQPRLRPGRGRPRGSQSVGVRILLRRATSVLRRRPRTVPVRRRLQRRQLLQRRPLLQPAHRAHAGARADVRRHGSPVAHDDPRRRQADRAIPERTHDRRARRDDAACVEPG